MKMRIWHSMAMMAAQLTVLGCDLPGTDSNRTGLHGGIQAGGNFEAGAAEAADGDDASDEENAGAADGSSNDPLDDEQPPLERQPPKPEILTWKRYRPFESALMSGLSLQKSELCLELGQTSCIDAVHLTVLGGNEPYSNGQYERAEAPTILTSVAVERIVLAACDKRLSLDKGLGSNAVVFKHWSLTGGKATPEQFKAQTQEIYRRLLARDATDDELGVAAELMGLMAAPDKLALGLCFMVGTQAESVFL